MNKISVLIPIYNSGSVVQQALHNVLMQTVAPFEVIITDDGSTTDDPNQHVASLKGKFEARGTNLKLIRHDQNRGRGAARQTGLRHANGNILAWFDVDDLWHPRKLQIQLGLLIFERRTSARPTLVSSNYHRVDKYSIRHCQAVDPALIEDTLPVVSIDGTRQPLQLQNILGYRKNFAIVADLKSI